MARAELHDAGEVRGSDTRVQFALDVRPDALGLPGRETALQTRVLCSSVPSRDQIDSQQCRRVLDAALCRATVGVHELKLFNQLGVTRGQMETVQEPPKRT